MNGTTQQCDIIIIGAGTAGCVLANRLSEDPGISIVVLEAGEEIGDDERVYTPALSRGLHETPHDWQYASEPQPGINGRTMKHARGKLVGGTSAINSFSMIYPSAAGIDVWADLGNDGWRWDDMKPYFRKFQTVCAPSNEIKEGLDVRYAEAAASTTSGPIQATLPLTVSPLSTAWLEAFRSIGLDNVEDPLDGNALGGYISTNHISGDRHERSHAGVAYFKPAAKRPNLHLITGAAVHRILFEDHSGGDAVASGVEYVKGGERLKIQAKTEVILSAGVFNSPQLLELSGIGDTNILRTHNIATIHHNANVGENLQDHLRAALSYEAMPNVTIPPTEAQRLYKESRTGPWAEQAAYNFAYMPLDRFMSAYESQQLSKAIRPHLADTTLTPFEQQRNAFIKKAIFSPSEATSTSYLSRRVPDHPEAAKKSWISLNTMLSHPFSRGNVHIVSSDAGVKPKIDFAYYSNPLDVEIHARHLQVLDTLASTAPIQKLLKRDGTCLPDRGWDGELKLDQAKEFVKAQAMTNYHPCGTCSMLPQEKGGVVNSRLRVYGTRNVRVVDASIFPIIPRGNIITTVYAVAERAADIISRDLGIDRTT